MIAQRHQTNETAHIDVYGKSHVAECALQNLSTTGACLSIKKGAIHTPQKDDLIRISIHLDKLDRKHVIDAQVVWSNDRTFGVNFIKHEDLLTRMLKKSSLPE